MSSWENTTAVVTGAASGIGLALSGALLQRGAVVWMADVNAAGLNQAAAALGPKAHPVALDVRDTLAVGAFIEHVIQAAGHLDFLFNNAGISVSGETHELTVGHFDRIIDINLRGMVNGSLAAYPSMVKQGHGHIINTASLAGVMPTPLATAYAMTKHAIVGFSTSLRLEAERYGVRVSVLCPAAVETAMLDANNPIDLPRAPWLPNVRRMVKNISATISPAQLAEEALRGVERNQALIIVPARARLMALMYRLAPALVEQATLNAVIVERKDRLANP